MSMVKVLLHVARRCRSTRRQPLSIPFGQVVDACRDGSDSFLRTCWYKKYDQRKKEEREREDST